MTIQEHLSKAVQLVATGIITQKLGFQAPKEDSIHRKLVENGVKELGRTVTR